MLRSTKIVATLGPASSEPAVLERMIRAGVDVVRLNFSHGVAADHERRVALVKELGTRTGRTVAILCDLQGPKIRVGKFKEGKITLERGQHFVLDATAEIGSNERVGLDYKELPQDVDAGSLLLLDDGKIVLEVTEVRGTEVHTRVRHGGALSNNKGINRQGGGLTAPALTSKDMEDIRTAAKLQAGDLAVEVGDAAVPALQKKMIRLAREHNKLTITATQMMESMISSPVPTRAEVSDVANAVLDGTDAVMLSAETASGRYPVEVIEAMDRVCTEAEQTQPLSLDQEFLNRVFTRVDQSIAMAALFTAYHLKVKCIASLTESGSTALWMSRLNAGVPIYALTSQTATRYRCALFRDVFPIMVKYIGHDREELLREAENVLVQHNVVKEGDIIVLTIGEPIGKSGGTNTMKIVKVGEHLKP